MKIHSTKNDQYWSFWCLWWPNHQDQEVFWGNMALEAVEASEVAEATEVNEAAEVCKAWKITTESSRFLKWIIWGLISLILVFWKKKFFWQNHENPCWILALFLSEVVEASLCYFFKNWLMKLKCPNLRNIQIPSL